MPSGHFCAVSAAFLQYAFGIYIFKQPLLNGCGPLLSCLIVMFALLLLLAKLTIYPPSLRKLWTSGHTLAEYIIAVFITEQVMGGFWFPLEIAMLAALPKMALTIEELIQQYFGWNCDLICDVLKWEITGVFCSYFLSFLILLAALHATRIIDLRLLDQGITVFFCDISQRLKNQFKNTKLFNFKMPRKKSKQRHPRVKFYDDDNCMNDELDFSMDDDY